MGCCGPSKEESLDDAIMAGSYIPLLEENETQNAGSPQDPASPADPRLDTLLLRLEYAKTWKGNMAQKKAHSEVENYRVKLLELFNAATMEMTRLINEERFDECDDVVHSIWKVKSALGEEFFQAAKINEFLREMSAFGDYVLTAGQYFKPVLLREEDDSVLKLYFFIISEAETAKVRLRYYVEHTSLVVEYFALGLATNGHTQLHVYGNTCPSYWTLRRDVLSDANRRLKDCFTPAELVD